MDNLTTESTGAQRVAVKAAPPWGTVETVMEHTGLTRRWLEELVAAGEVRKRKHGGKTGRAVYCIADVLEHLGGGDFNREGAQGAQGA